MRKLTADGQVALSVDTYKHKCMKGKQIERQWPQSIKHFMTRFHCSIVCSGCDPTECVTHLRGAQVLTNIEFLHIYKVILNCHSRCI